MNSESASTPLHAAFEAALQRELQQRALVGAAPGRDELMRAAAAAQIGRAHV